MSPYYCIVSDPDGSEYRGIAADKDIIPDFCTGENVIVFYILCADCDPVPDVYVFTYPGPCVYADPEGVREPRPLWDCVDVAVTEENEPQGETFFKAFPQLHRVPDLFFCEGSQVVRFQRLPPSLLRKIQAPFLRSPVGCPGA